MEGTGSSSITVKNKVVPHTIRTALVSAVLEWFLIFLLLIDASFSYMVTKFARYCKLQIPCLLCSRLDHFLGKEEKGFYWDLFCHNHKLKISSLVLCHLHENLVDVHGICESCLFSFATVNKSNAETYRLLVGKLGDEQDVGLDPDPLLADDNSNTLNGRKCSCCNEQYISKNHAEMFQMKTIGYGAVEFSEPLVATSGHDDRVELKENTEVLLQTDIAFPSLEQDIKHLPHVEYQKVKTTSDTESTGYEAADINEPLLSTMGHDRDELKEFVNVSSQKLVDSLSGKYDIVESFTHVEYEKVEITCDTESLGYEAGDVDTPLLVNNGDNKNKLKDLTDISPQKIKVSREGKKDIYHLSHVEYEKVKITSDTESETCFSDEERASKLMHVVSDGNQKFSAEYREKDITVSGLASEKMMNPSYVGQPSILDSEVHVEASDLHTMSSSLPIRQCQEELSWQHVDKKTDAAPELISFRHTLPFSNVAQSTSNVAEETSNFIVPELGKTAKENDEMAELASNLTSTNEKKSDLKSATSDSSSQIPNLLELSDAYKLAVGSRGRQLSGKLLEQRSFTDSMRLSEDVKHLLSQLSTRGIELQLNDMSPRVSANIDELKTEASGSIGLQILQKRISLERNESGISLDGSTVSEIEGESVVDRLRRQVEHDKRLMGALYKELEEERNASADAANQAMAMITRLQEEKAALHMEALQCLRMMEEQAEYDSEALLKATDILAAKEKQIQDLAAELEVYKERFGHASPKGNLEESNCDTNAQEMNVQKLEASLSPESRSVCSSGDIMSTTRSKTDYTANFTGDQDIYLRRSLTFEEESSHILHCLNKLEKKLELFSNDDSFSEEEKVKVCNWEELDYTWNTLENGETKVNPENTVVNIESCSAVEGSALDCKHSEHESKGNGELEPRQHFYRDTGIEALRNEFLVLNGRLKSLQAEHSFLGHAMRSLSKGDEGLKFIQEIACQVRELHSIGIKSRN
ncbi:hypothetical protein M9H77_07744 [Catharanthus roseus]|uniref:Uncharacterized protein n=1 Tax=Catharanthus roseus TaxID=4058 RepID=A0ACC0BW02_CATRO|nr:hypothetical protein M9H77_07744 [Catharanthus roseus]